jgi:2-polyprenyl-6-methoxyphenol hydroxylase-like FAD-dependent oxidoreductase
VLGAGPAGTACALALARAGVGRVVLVDAGGPGVAIGETIPPDTRLLLDRLGLWTAFLAEGHEPCLGSCSAWGNADLGFNDFILTPHGAGWHLDRARFDDFLRRRAGEASVIRLEGARLAGTRPNGGGGDDLRLATLAGEVGLRAAFVVDATGRASAFARRVGARQTPLDRLTFVYGFFDATGGQSSSRLTLIEATEEGWWYAARLPGERLAVAIAADAERVRADRLAHEGRWLRAGLATRQLAPRLDGCRFLSGSLTARVAAGFRLDRAAGARWLAIGDAASVFDPLAAQGIHKALADGLEGAALIAEALARNGELGPEHGRTLDARFDEYLVARNHFYGLERRWPASEFWRRRQARGRSRPPPDGSPRPGGHRGSGRVFTARGPGRC